MPTPHGPENREDDLGKSSSSSVAVEDFIGVVPGWLLRRGNATLFGVFLALIVGAWMLEYPDVVSAPVTITTESPPAPVVARTSGRLAQLYVGDGDEVERGQWLAVVSNAADTEDVRALSALLRAFAGDLSDPASFDAQAHGLGAELELGDMQVEYATFVAAWKDLRAGLDDPYFEASARRIRDQLDTSEALAGTLRTQRRGLEADLSQAKREASTVQGLARDGIVAATDADSALGLVRQRRRAVGAAEVDLLDSELGRVNLDRARLDLDHELRERQRERLRAVRDAYAALSGSWETWRRDYLLLAPMAGRVSLDQVWSPQQWVAEDDEVMTVIPTLDTLVARVTLGQLNSGKVEVGQRVLIKLEGYPFREFGVVEGRVDSVPAIARDGVYLVNVGLPQGLETNQGRTLELRHDMGGRAEIVTAEHRLLARLFIQLRGLTSR